MDPIIEMQFEYTMQLFFHKGAEHIAGQANSRTHRRDWLLKALCVILKQIDRIETTPRHRQVLMANVEAVQHSLRRDSEPSWELAFRLFAVVGRLLGFDFNAGARCHTLAYYQTPSQHFTADLLAHGHPAEHEQDKKDAVTLRGQVISSLKSAGVSDFKIALVLNTTEYEVKKLRRGLGMSGRGDR